MHRVTDVADLVRLVRLETVLRIAVLVRINGHGSDAQFVGGTKGPDRDLPRLATSTLENTCGSLIRMSQISVDQ